VSDAKKIRKLILKKMYRRRIIGAKHTAIENLSKSVPKDSVGFVRDIIAELIKENFIVKKPTNYGLQVSLNKERIKEIERIIFN
jgi:hypothetical protein